MAIKKSGIAAPLLELAPVMRGLTSAYATSGIIHLVRPSVFEPAIPRELPAHRNFVYASGVVELALVAGLLNRQTRRVAGWASAATLVSFVPAHIEMTRAAVERLSRKGASPMTVGVVAGNVVRTALQWPLISASLKLAGK